MYIPRHKSHLLEPHVLYVHTPPQLCCVKPYIQHPTCLNPQCDISPKRQIRQNLSEMKKSTSPGVAPLTCCDGSSSVTRKHVISHHPPPATPSSHTTRHPIISHHPPPATPSSHTTRHPVTLSSHTTRHPPPRHLTPPATRHPVISHHPPPRHLTPPATRHPVILHHPPLRQLSCPSFNSQPKAGWVQAAMVLHALRGRQAAWPHLPLSPHHLAAARPGCLPWLQVLATFTSSSAHTDGIRPVSDSVQACPPCQSTMPCHHALPCPALPPPHPVPATALPPPHPAPVLRPVAGATCLLVRTPRA